MMDIPKIDQNADINKIREYLNMLVDRLRFELSTIDEDNFTDEFMNKLKEGKV